VIRPTRTATTTTTLGLTRINLAETPMRYIARWGLGA
jgi:hypothetical protein